MPRKDTKLEKLSEMIYVTVEEISNLRVDGLDHMFMEIYSEQACQLTDSRQQNKVKHSLKDILGIVFFAVLIRRFVLFIVKLLKAYYHRSMKRIRNKIGRNLELEIPVILTVRKVLYDNDMLDAIDELAK